MYKLGKSEIDISGLNLIGSGSNGNVYKYKKQAIKVLPKEKGDNFLDLDTCIKLTSINTECILLPRNVLYKNNTYQGYSLKYVGKSGSINKIIVEHRNVLLNNISLLENDSNILSKRGFLLDGITPDNAIVDDKIYITDPLLYSYIGEEYYEGLDKLNNYQIHLLLSSLIMSSLKKSGVTPANLRKIKAIITSKEAEEKSSVFFNRLLKDDENIKSFVKTKIK